MVDSVGYARTADIFLCVATTFLARNYMLITCSASRPFSNYPFLIILVHGKYNDDLMNQFIR